MTALSPGTVADLRELLRRPGARETVAHAIETAGHCEHPGGESCAPWWQAEAAIGAVLEMARALPAAELDAPRGSVQPSPIPEFCTYCGPGYRYGSEGCRHTPPGRQPPESVVAEVLRRMDEHDRTAARPFPSRSRAVDGTDPNPEETR